MDQGRGVGEGALEPVNTISCLVVDVYWSAIETCGDFFLLRELIKTDKVVEHAKITV